MGLAKEIINKSEKISLIRRNKNKKMIESEK